MKITSYGVFFLSILLILAVGCQDIIDDALKTEVDVEEPLVNDQTVTGSPSTLSLISSPLTLSKALSGGMTLQGTEVLTATPLNAEVFSAIMEQDAGQLSGHVDNSNNSTGVLSILLSATNTLTDPLTEGTLVDEIALTGQTSVDILITSGFDEFFIANPDITPFYVYLVLTGSSVSITVDALDFLLPAYTEVEHVIEMTDSLLDQGDVEEVINTKIAGSVENNGSATVTLQVDIDDQDAGTTLGWEGTVLLPVDIAAGATQMLENLDPVDAKLNGALDYLATTGSVRAVVILSSSAVINVDLQNINLVGTAVVVPN